jgi:hypothetical protein
MDFMSRLAKDRGLAPDQFEQQIRRRGRPTSLLRRLATARRKWANMVVYVCSPQAAAPTGAALLIDGGVVRSTA